eukprot:2020959-Ditylum_brightwellii.AAC.1
MLTFKTDIPSVEHIEYKVFSKNLDVIALNILKRLIAEKGEEYKRVLGKEKGKMNITVSVLFGLLESIKKGKK